MRKEKLKIAFIGAWGHGGGLLRSYLRDPIPEVELVGLAPTHPGEGCWELPSQYDHVQRYEDYRCLLESQRPDAAVVSSRLQYINQAVLTALESGCSVLSEKPIAASFDELDKLSDAARKNKKNLLLLLQNRANPCLKAVKNLVDQNIIGDPVLINARKSYPWRPERAENILAVPAFVWVIFMVLGTLPVPRSRTARRCETDLWSETHRHLA